MEFNLRSVPCRISSAFPTLDGVNEAVALAKRAGLKEGRFGSGDGVVIGIGSGAAMDLAKAVSDSLFGNIAPSIDGSDDAGGSLVLAPCTLGGLWAASSNSPSLLLDTKEEMILPHLTSSWTAASNNSSRRGTALTLDAAHQLAMPSLYTRFQPMKRSEYSSSPSMAHVAAAVLAILFDAARSLDVAGMTNDSGDLQLNVQKEMEAVAASCAAVLQLAIEEAKSNGGDESDTNTKLAQQHLLDAISRLSPLMEQCSLFSNMSVTTTGTIPQKLANALLPAYFPQCHLVTYLACTLPGLCDVLSTSSSSGGDTSMVEAVANSIIHQDGPVSLSSLSSWASHVTMEAGIPSMASLAYGTPDLNTLVGALDSYESLVASINGSGSKSGSGGQDDSWVMEDVLQKCLSR